MICLWRTPSFKRLGDLRAKAHSCRRLSSGINKKWNVLFFGSDDFSCSILDKIIQEDLVANIHVITPTPQPGFTPSLSILSRRLSIPNTPWYRPFTIPKIFSTTPTDSNILLSASFGHLIPTSLINKFPAAHALNVHPSLLPQWRGPAPVFWTLLNGDERTGVTIQELQKGAFDGGRILMQKEIDVLREEDYSGLMSRLKVLSADMTVELLRNYKVYKSNIRSQDIESVSHAPKITREHSRIDWEKWDLDALFRHHRALGHKHPLWTHFFPSPPAPHHPKTANHISYRLSFTSLKPISSEPHLKDFLSHLVKLPGDFEVWKENSKFRVFIRCVDGWCEVEKVHVMKAGRPKELKAGEWFTGYVKARAVEGRFVTSLDDETVE